MKRLWSSLTKTREKKIQSSSSSSSSNMIDKEKFDAMTSMVKKILEGDDASLRQEMLEHLLYDGSIKEILAQMNDYKNAKWTWAQEEPKNAGAWIYAEPRLRNMQDHLNVKSDLSYAGRPIMAATAVGYTSHHNE